MNDLLRIALALPAALIFGCSGGDSTSGDMGTMDAGAPDEALGEQPVFADLSAAVQVDRVGKPLLNRLVIPLAECGVVGESCRTTYNRNESPASDAASFGIAALAQLADPTPVALWQGDMFDDLEAADFLALVWGNPFATPFGDLLIIDTSAASAYTVGGGGRAPGDDVVDTTLDAMTSRSAALGFMAGAASDSIDANDKAFLPDFPYFATPTP